MIEMDLGDKLTLVQDFFLSNQSELQIIFFYCKIHQFNFSCIVENAKQENAVVIIINNVLHESPK